MFVSEAAKLLSRPIQSQPSSSNRVRYGAILGTGREQPFVLPGNAPPAAGLQHTSYHAAIFLTLCDQRSKLGPRSAKRPMYGYGSLADGSVPAYFFADIGSTPHEHIGLPIAFRC